ncbi:DUF481 domain-containing protein [Agaribacterium sp. ZY112]|uniref:DUF481 domain-containing protein n=1 Tax=Agaribacterium sp. ZY112 TaxID=3233574 RepID=UPI0035255A68
MLDNGDHLEGELSAITAVGIVWASPVFGEITVPKNSVVDLVSSVPMKLRGYDGVCYWAGFEQRRVTFECEGGNYFVLELLEVKEALMYEGYALAPFDHNGYLRATGYQEAGQVTKQDWNIEAGINIRHLDMRHSLTYKFRAESSNSDDKLYQRWEPRYQFDWFFAPQTYLTSSASVLRDELRLIDLRASLGAGLGYQFWESQRSALSIETGPQYLQEQLSDSQDSSMKTKEQYATWRLAMDGRVELPREIKLYSKVEMLQALRDQEEWKWNTESGLAMPIAGGVTADINFIYNYDNLPPDGVAKLDSRLSVGLGFKW